MQYHLAHGLDRHVYQRPNKAQYTRFITFYMYGTVQYVYRGVQS